MSGWRSIVQFLAGLYAGLQSVLLGAVLLDIVYAGLLEKAGASPAVSTVYAEVSDFLLLLGALTLLGAGAAIVAAWRAAPARNLWLAGVALLVGGEFLAPILLFSFLRGAPASALAGLGPYLRLTPAALAFGLAWAGLHRLYLHGTKAGPA